MLKSTASTSCHLPGGTWNCPCPAPGLLPLTPATSTADLLQEALEAGQPAERDESGQVLVENELLSRTTGGVVERNLLTVSDKPLVGSPAATAITWHAT